MPEQLAFTFFSGVLDGKLLFLIFLAITAGGTIRFTAFLLKESWYDIGQRSRRSEKHSNQHKVTWGDRIFNKYFLLEICLVVRNRRIISFVALPFYCLLLTYLVFIPKPVNEFNMQFFWYLCVSGVWGYSYLQYAFSLESSFYDFLLTSTFDFVSYLKAKYIINALFTIFITSLALPVVFMSHQDIHIVFSALFYNISIGFVLILFAAAFNRQRMDLNKSFVFNYQGDNLIRFIALSGSVLLPLGLFSLGTFFLGKFASLLVINLISLLVILKFDLWLKLVNKHMLKRKYKSLITL